MTTSPDQVVVISDFSTAKGGASKLAVLLATLLSNQAVPVTLFAGDQLAGHEPRDFACINLGSSALLKANPVRSAINGIWNRQANQRLASWSAENDTPGTIYHVHGFLQTLSPSIFSTLQSVRHRVVVHAHDYFLACPNGAFFDYKLGVTCDRVPLSTSCITCNCDKRNYAQKLWRVARQSALNSALKTFRQDATFILLHDRMADYLQRRSAFKNCPTVANPAEAYLDVPLNAEKNSWFCYVGDIHDYKGVYLFAEAAQRANVTAHFIGDGQDAEVLKDKYPDAVFHGWQDRNGLRCLLANARAVVVPSRGPEPFGLTCVEAMLSGIPVIASDSILLAEAIEQHNGGKSFVSGDAQSLADTIRQFDSDDGLVAELSLNARDAATKLSCTPDDWIRQIMEIYGIVLSGNIVDNPSSFISKTE